MNTIRVRVTNNNRDLKEKGEISTMKSIRLKEKSNYRSNADHCEANLCEASRTGVRDYSEGSG
jgi:hypothetical protein